MKPLRPGHRHDAQERREGVRRRGLTLVELLVTLAISGVILSAGVTMLVATDRGTSNDRGLRSLVVQSKVVQDRIDAAVRSSRAVLAVGDGFIVLWIGDTRDDDTPNISELKRIEHDQEGGLLNCHTGLSTLPEAQDTPFDLATTDFDTETAKLIGTAAFPQETWGRRVTRFEVSLDAMDPVAARLVSYRLGIETDQTEDVVPGSAAPRGLWD